MGEGNGMKLQGFKTAANQCAFLWLARGSLDWFSDGGSITKMHSPKPPTVDKEASGPRSWRSRLALGAGGCC